MGNETHEYEVSTNKGTVSLKTPHHHSKWDDIEDFIKAHQATIDAATGVTSIVLNVYFGTRKLK